MGRLAVVDASIIIAVLDPDDALHAPAIVALSRDDQQLVAPATVYAEVLVHPYRVGNEEAARIANFFDDLPIAVRDVDRRTAATAARLRAAANVPLGDAVVLATGEELGADAVLTGDRRWRPIDARVELIHA
jgi:predicted nucleic acid-binding protein